MAVSASSAVFIVVDGHRIIIHVVLVNNGDGGRGKKTKLSRACRSRLGRVRRGGARIVNRNARARGGRPTALAQWVVFAKIPKKKKINRIKLKNVVYREILRPSADDYLS